MAFRVAMARFCRFDLRTTDAEAARAFYGSVLGHERSKIWPLHEQALARGAKPHWLGGIAVDDVELASARFVERGATPLGGTRPTADGGQSAVLRDPGGAIVALTTPPLAPLQPLTDIAWYALNTNDVTRAAANYGELFGWALTARLDLGAEGIFQQFAWEPGGESIGVMGDIATRPNVHPHWLFFFEVAALDPAMAAARAAGGLVLDPLTLPGGARLCACDDPQGAAFGLYTRK